MKIHKMSDFSEKIEIPDDENFCHTFYNHPGSIEGAWAFWKVGTHQTAFELALRSLTAGQIAPRGKRTLDALEGFIRQFYFGQFVKKL